MTLAERLAATNERITRACQRTNRSEYDVTLVAVSKTKSAASIREAYELGQRDFGENYVQELVEKREQLADLRELRWHFIGALQSNKAKFLVGNCHLIHGIASFSALTAVNRLAEQREVVQSVLLEVNTSQETSKSGLDQTTLFEIAERLNELRHVRCLGLMTLGPLTDDKETTRRAFHSLRAYRETLRARYRLGDFFSQLSMGMSDDFEIAIEEGSTIVRVGSAIFGPRK